MTVNTPCTTCCEDIDTSADDQITWRKASQGQGESWAVHRGDCLVEYLEYVKSKGKASEAIRADIDARVTASEKRRAATGSED